MFGTVLSDIYRHDEKGLVRKAIANVCDTTQNGFATSGIYAFFDPSVPPFGTAASSRILYVGLATDLAHRFAQHNGIRKSRDGSNKWPKIQAWFSQHDELGVSLWVRSALEQPYNRRFRTSLSSSERKTAVEYYTDRLDNPMKSVAHVEGLLIEAAKVTYGTIPPWNDMGGSREGAAHAAAAGDPLLRLMALDGPSLFNARHTIRELSANNTWFYDEVDLHQARMTALANTAFSRNAAAGNGDILRALERITQLVPGERTERLILECKDFIQRASQ